MARPPKEGLNYFPLDVDFLSDKKVKLLKAEFGAAGVLVFLSILTEIYRNNGYFMRWDKDDSLLMAEEVGCGLDSTVIEEIVQGCIRRSLFDSRVANVFGVLTSSGIQRRYLRAAAERSNIYIIEEYLLLDTDNEKDVPKGILKKVALKSISGTINSPNRPINSQSRVKESKGEESRVEESRVASAEKPPSEATTTPTLTEIISFCQEEKLIISPERFFNVNEARSWTAKGTPITDWKSLAREWNRTERPKEGNSGGSEKSGRRKGKSQEPSVWAGYEEDRH